MSFLRRLSYMLALFALFVVTFVILSYKGLRFESGPPLTQIQEPKGMIRPRPPKGVLTITKISPSSSSSSSSTISTSSATQELNVTTPKSKVERLSPYLSSSSSGIFPSTTSASTAMDLIHSLFNLGLSDPASLISKLTNSDIFMTKQGVDNFTCPTADSALDYPNFIFNKKNAEDFKAKKKGSFIFFQHLRKAGGTSFCDFARSNMPRKNTPNYYCMPDDKGSLATPPWSDFNYLKNDIDKHDYRIVANEWDVFYSKFTSYKGAVFGTTIRDAIDRYYSQYRFEYLEHRDGSAPDSPRPVSFMTWYNDNKNWMMGSNYYVKTFIGSEDKKIPKNPQGDFYWTYHKFNQPKYQLTWEDMKSAIENIRKFHLILVLDWINDKATHRYIHDALGWDVPPKQVLPHESQAIRADKHSKKAIDELEPDDFLTLQKENVFDVLFFEITKRIVLERMHCS